MHRVKLHPQVSAPPGSPAAARPSCPCRLPLPLRDQNVMSVGGCHHQGRRALSAAPWPSGRCPRVPASNRVSSAGCPAHAYVPDFQTSPGTAPADPPADPIVAFAVAAPSLVWARIPSLPDDAKTPGGSGGPSCVGSLLDSRARGARDCSSSSRFGARPSLAADPSTAGSGPVALGAPSPCRISKTYAFPQPTYLNRWAGERRTAPPAATQARVGLSEKSEKETQRPLAANKARRATPAGMTTQGANL